MNNQEQKRFKLSYNEVCEIGAASFFGGAFFGTLAFIKAVSQKKMAADVPLQVPFLRKCDPSLVVLLGELNRTFYKVCPLVCDNICLLADHLIVIRLNQEKKSKKDCRDHGFICYELYKKSRQFFINNKLLEDTNNQTIIKKIDQHIQSHLEAIMTINSEPQS